MRIHERAETDLDPLVEVLWRVHGTGYPSTWPDAPRDWISPDGLLGAWVAIHDDQVVGHVGVAVPAPGRMAEVTRLFVDPSHRGKGIADALLAAAEAAAPGTHLRLDVTEETPDAWRLYERRGWCMTGRGPADWSKPSGEVPTVRYYAKRVG
ncbi:GNAT family N-acetyltransferase [Curtobacterium sp. 1544]|jgi:GNAT superfamily N-acetyltransferase|uniref:GNAT family N-acetyltransferase n=1 Tax=Curtobacterium sp. 1544 TaxID=3156417 RepID=UPI0033968112